MGAKMLELKTTAAALFALTGTKNKKPVNTTDKPEIIAYNQIAKE